MNIAMFTNTYLPHVGGVARSVSTFQKAYTDIGHKCLVVAPEFEGDIEDEQDVCRVPAITNFNDSGFSFRLPFGGDISNRLDEFKPDIVHAHHPFLLGDSALRAAYARNIPVVFTHHTLYEQYTNYLPFESDFTQKAAIELATGFANSASAVFAPSQSVADLIKERGVEVDVFVQPTGIDFASFSSGDKLALRNKYQIPNDAPLFGHVGRLAKEKNLEYLVEAAIQVLRENESSWFVLVGDGEISEELVSKVKETGLQERFVSTGSLSGKDLYDAYASFDVFIFSSQSETQGLVLAEAMASGSAVVALDGPGVRDVLRDTENGLLLPADAQSQEFANAIDRCLRDTKDTRNLSQKAIETAESLSTHAMALSSLAFYEKIIAKHESWIDSTGMDGFDKIISTLEGEFQLLKVKAATLANVIGD